MERLCLKYLRVLGKESPPSDKRLLLLLTKPASEAKLPNLF